MRTSHPNLLLLAATALVASFFLLPANADEHENVFKLESLKYVYTVKMKSGDNGKVNGTFSSEEYNDGASENIAFTGTIEGNAMKVTLEKEPMYCAMTDADTKGIRVWKFSQEHETIFIPIHSQDEDLNPVIAKMPLDLAR